MFERLIERLALALDEGGLPYLVIGGQAVLLYGEPRLTRDIDITLGVGPDRLTDVLQMVHSAGLTTLVADPPGFVRQTLVLPCEDPGTGIRVDLIFSFSPYEQQAMDRARAVPVGRAAVRFASPEDLIIHKTLAGRPRDMEDVRNVLLRQPEIDVSYVRMWLGDLGRDLQESLIERFQEIYRGVSGPEPS